MAKIENFQQAEEAVEILALGHQELEAALGGLLKLGELVRLQDTQIRGQDVSIKAQAEQIKLLTFLVDAHHKLFIEHGWAPPRPTTTRDPLAN